MVLLRLKPKRAGNPTGGSMLYRERCLTVTLLSPLLELGMRTSIVPTWEETGQSGDG